MVNIPVTVTISMEARRYLGTLGTAKTKPREICDNISPLSMAFGTKQRIVNYVRSAT